MMASYLSAARFVVSIPSEYLSIVTLKASSTMNRATSTIWMFTCPPIDPDKVGVLPLGKPPPRRTSPTSLIQEPVAVRVIIAPT